MTQVNFEEWENDSTGCCTAIGVDSDGKEVAAEFCCVEPGCNCTGGWVVGNTSQVVEWIYRETI